MKSFTRLSSFLLGVSSAIAVSACGNDSAVAKDTVKDFPPSQTKATQEQYAAVVPPSEKPELEPVVESVGETPVVQMPEPETYSEFIMRGRELSKAGDVEAALADFRVAADKKPDVALPKIQMARMLLAMGKPGEAREHVEAAIEIDGSSSLAWNTMGRLELAEQNVEAAISSFERAAEEDSDNSYAWNNLGYLLIEQKDFEGAARALEQATTGVSPTGYMWNNLGMAYEHLDRIVEARAAYRQAVEAGSDKAQANFDRLEGVVSLKTESEVVGGAEDTDSEDAPQPEVE